MDFTQTVASQSQPGVTYTLTVASGRATCNCPGYTNTDHCWHTDAAYAFLELLRTGPGREYYKRSKAQPRRKLRIVP